ncbi:MAG: 4a-hydroxytetrahydrobiopterin dehydratase [Myxococcales bacterium]|nr:4a-hydroxytetrahydrobiopterin dehydratase [Myxococcales bacterium]
MADGEACALAEKDCVPCRGGVPPMGAEEIAEYLPQLDPSWSINEAGHLERQFETEDFAQALALANALGAIAEAQWHHPDLTVRWGSVGVEIWTHKINGLTESDFVLAARFDRAAEA